MKRTKLLCLRNIVFRNRGLRLRHSDPSISEATTVSITFESQKNGEQNETVTMHHSADDDFSPVSSWAAIVQRVLSYPGTDQDSAVCTIMLDGKLSLLRSTTVLKKLRGVVAVIGEARLGFLPDDVGTHSIRSGGAMAMFLDDTISDFTIMLIGRWKSLAFLKYIRKQVEQFSHNVSTRMLRNREFFTIPDFSVEENSIPTGP